MNFRLVEGDLATILWKAPDDQVNGPSAVEWDMAYAANQLFQCMNIMTDIRQAHLRIHILQQMKH